jgi:Putative inner membrane protein (DUF1819)
MRDVSPPETHWRAQGPYLPTLASKTALIEETRLFLETYDRCRDIVATTQILLNERLPQRSRSTRKSIVTIIQARLVRWNPPDWVREDLLSFALEPSLDALRAALLLHIARQDHLLYDFAQHIATLSRERWVRSVFPYDVQTFLDDRQEEAPEILRWSFHTRSRLATGVLTTLRDCGLLKEKVNKRLWVPLIPENVVNHLIRLLRAENIPQEQIAHHPDWQLWLWSPEQAQSVLRSR